MTRPGALRAIAVAAVAGAAAALAATSASNEAQPPASASASEAAPAPNGYPHHPYDGRFTFVRLQYTVPERYAAFGRSPEEPWHHDYPRAERHLMKILDETTLIGPTMGGGNILRADDPELFRYPVAYLSEPGYWTQTDAEAAALRAWLLKGGFLIFDDFRGYDWENFTMQLRRVLPEARLVELDVSHPIFDSFFEIESLDLPDWRSGRYPPRWFGAHEDNDPSKRLLLIANYNNDIGEYWEYSDQGWLPIDLSNEAYKLGVNYMVYALTH